MLVRLSRTTLCGITLAVSSVVLVAGCGSGGGKKAVTGTLSPAQTKAAIRQTWEAFFDGSTASAKRVSLLQNGSKFAKTIAAVDSSPLAKGVKAEVSSVTIDGPTTATVTFSVLLSGTPLVSGITGTAVLVDGAWKVSVTSFCQLASLEGTVPKACPAAG